MKSWQKRWSRTPETWSSDVCSSDLDWPRCRPSDRSFHVRSRNYTLCLHAGDFPRAGGDPQSFAAAAYAPDVAHQRHFGHFGGGGDHDYRRVWGDHAEQGARVYRHHRRGDQHRQRVPHHRPHAQDVQEAGREEIMLHLVSYVYIVSSALFILSLKWMNSPVTARRSVLAGEVGMLMAIAGVLLSFHVFNWEWILAAFFIGTAVGIPIAYIMPMTAVPQRTAMSHACGAVGTAEFYKPNQLHETFVMVPLMLETLLGFLTFTGSLMAMGKLQEVLPQRPITYRNQNLINFVLFGIAAGLGVWLIVTPAETWIFPI